MPDTPYSMHVIGSRGPGGAEKFFVRLVAALHRSGNPVAAVVRPRSAVERGLPVELPRHRAGMRGNWDLLARARLRRLVRDERPAVVQTYMGRATRLTRLPPGPAVHVARLGGYYDLEGYRHAAAWVGNTRGICDYLVREGLPGARVFHIGNFVEPGLPASPEDRARGRAEAGIPDDALVMLTAARLHPNKGLDVLLEAVSRLPAAIGGRRLLFCIAGDGPLGEPLARLGRQLGVADRVRWLGWRDDVAALYRLADLFVCPSRHEPLGNVILEAWSHGAPVLAAAAAGPAEIVSDGEDGRLVPVDDPVALADGVRELLDAGEPTLATLAAAGRRTLESRFSPEAVTGAYVEMYRGLASG